MTVRETSLLAFMTRDIDITQENQIKIIRALKTANNLTDREIQQLTGLKINIVTARRNDLIKFKPNGTDSYIVEDERRKCRVGERKSIAWKISECYLNHYIKEESNECEKCHSMLLSGICPVCRKNTA
jgi:hypothetical protein